MINQQGKERWLLSKYVKVNKKMPLQKAKKSKKPMKKKTSKEKQKIN